AATDRAPRPGRPAGLATIDPGSARGRARAPPPSGGRACRSPGSDSASRSASLPGRRRATDAGSTSGLCITWTWTPPHRFGSETSLGTDSTGTGGDRISHAPPAAARPDGPGRHHARRPWAERRRQDRAAQIAPRALAPPRRQARAPAGPLAARRIRAAARPPRYELAPARPGRRVDGPGTP